MTFANFRAQISSSVAVALCFTLMQSSVFARTTITQKAASPDRVLHALNRFTFGPRPGEEDAVKSVGLDKWFERQLHPGSIDDSALEARLADFPAMLLPESELASRYPSPAIIRRLAKTDAELPRDPVERAIYGEQIAAYKLLLQRRAAHEKSPAVVPAGTQDEAGMTPEQQKTADTVTENAARQLEVTVDRLPREQVDELIALPPDARFNRILAMPVSQLIALRKSVRPAMQPRLVEGFTPQQKEILLSLQGSNRMIGAELLQTRLLRDIYSERQVEAVMTDFWLNHFNVYLKKNANAPATIPAYERDIVRKNALGNFETLLTATAKSPAMLLYLDNATSVGPNSQAAARAVRFGKKASPGLNENYARELMELHTLGVNGGYTQHDVTEVARVFTGWSVRRGPGYGGDEDGGFDFNERRHDPGTKTVLGHEINESGEAEGMQVLHLLATSPATAQFISRKLAIRFVSDNPPQSLVDSMAKTFLQTKGDIKSVLRTLFHAPEFWAPENDRAKLKTPLEYVVSAARVSNAQITNALPLALSLDTLGMPLYGALPPTGYKWDSAAWLSSSALVNRMNFALLLSTNRIGGTQVDWQTTFESSRSARLTPVSLTPVAGTVSKEQRLESVILGFSASAQTRATVLAQQGDEAAQQATRDFPLTTDPPIMQEGNGMKQKRQNRYGRAGMEAGPAPSDPQAAAMAGLLLGSPEFQRR